MKSFKYQKDVADVIKYCTYYDGVNDIIRYYTYSSDLCFVFLNFHLRDYLFSYM